MSLPKWQRPSGLTPRAVVVWKRLAPTAVRAGTLTPASAEKFRVLVELLALQAAAAAEINQSGVVFATSSGQRKSNPACAILFLAQKQAGELLHDFNLDEDG